MKISNIIKQSQDAGLFSKEQLIEMVSLSFDAPEGYQENADKRGVLENILNLVNEIR